MSARGALQLRLDGIVSRNERVTARLRHTGGLPERWPDRSVVLADEILLAALDDAERAEITAIQAAMRRIDDGTWGVCDACGTAIPAARLDALPFASNCVSCAEGAGT